MRPPLIRKLLECEMKRLLLLFVFLPVLGNHGFSQQDSLFFQKVDTLLQLFESSSFLPIEFEDTSLEVIEAISKSERTMNFNDRSAYIMKQRDLAKRDIGLSAFGSYLENINPTFGDLEENLVYQRRFQAGVQWDVLRNGWLENKAKTRIYEDRLLREQLQSESANQNFHFLKRFDQTIYVFNEIKIDLLDRRKAQLQKQYEIVTELVLLKQIKKEEMIDVETRLTEVESLIKVYKDYNDYLEIDTDSLDLDPNNLPLIDLDYESIFNLIELQTDSVLGGRVYKDYYKWYHQIGLRPHFRYNFFDLIGDGNRSFFSTGVNLNIPIPFNTKLRNDIENEKWLFDNERLVLDRTSLHEDVLNTGYEFRYKLKQFVSFVQKRKMFVERLRVEKVKVRLKDRNIDPLAGLELYDDLLRIDVELVDLLQNLYLKALKVHSKIPNSNIRDIVVCHTPDDYNQYIDNKERAVYVWSKTFGDYSPEFLAEYAIYNEYKKVVIAVQKTDTIKNKEIFMNMAQETAEVHFMLGNNRLFYDADIVDYCKGVLEEYPTCKPDGFHLDIEPHTFPEWKTNKQKMVNQYVEMVGKVSSFCEENDFELAISIPLHYGKEVIDRLFSMCDQIYFMCYENVDTDYIVRKVVPFIDNAKDKITLAFRQEDFANRIEMEEKINLIESKTELKSYAYHDLRRMIEWDRKSIEK